MKRKDKNLAFIIEMKDKTIYNDVHITFSYDWDLI